MFMDNEWIRKYEIVSKMLKLASQTTLDNFVDTEIKLLKLKIDFYKVGLKHE